MGKVLAVPARVEAVETVLGSVVGARAGDGMAREMDLERVVVEARARAAEEESGAVARVVEAAAKWVARTGVAVAETLVAARALASTAMVAVAARDRGLAASKDGKVEVEAKALA